MIKRRDIRAWLLESSPRVSVGITMALLATVMTLDFASPRYLSFGTFYLVIIAYASWVLDRRAGWLAAIVGIGGSLAINGFGAYVAMASGTGKEIAMAWSLAMRLLSAGAVVELVRSFRSSFNQERRLGEIDPLTGLLNRRAFRSRAAKIAARAHQHGRVGLLAYADLDGFKPINDRYGHGAGDGVLTKFSDILSATIRSTDCLGRSGGDEFVLFLDVPTLDEAKRVALNLERRLNGQLKALDYAGLSCSLGAVLVPPDGTLPSIDTLISQADRLMYEAKQSRFTRIECANTLRH